MILGLAITYLGKCLKYILTMEDLKERRYL